MDELASTVRRNDASPTSKPVLRLLTCGSVDDGKSTLIGRLLFDGGSVPEDTLAAAKKLSETFGTTEGDLDYALLLDGLQAERAQGITIDVAYRYFSSAKRKFIIADTPGHVQYTRNMVTGASNCDLALLLVDARNGISDQTRRHACIVNLMGIRDVVLAVNKMDLVEFDEARFREIEAAFQEISAKLGIASVTSIPVSALLGENLTRPSSSMPWYQGKTILQHMEDVDASVAISGAGFRMPVQWVCRPNQEFRGYAGSIVSGEVKTGDAVVALPSAQTSEISDIVTYDGSCDSAHVGDAVTLSLTTDIDISRGDVICAAKDRPQVADQFSAHIVWMQQQPLLGGRTYVLQLGAQRALAHVSRIKHKLNLETLDATPTRKLEANDVGVCNISTNKPLVIEPYLDSRHMGGFMLIDRATNETACAGMIEHALYRGQNIHLQSIDVSRDQRSEIKGHKSCCLWFTGLSGSGKSTVANALERRLHEDGFHTYILDGDNVRHGLNQDLGFTDADRVENIRRVSEVSKLMVDAGLITIVSFISPFRAERRSARERFGDGEFIEVFVDTPLEICEARDAKGLYAKARAGEIPNFTGISSPYEAPEAPDIHLAGGEKTPDELADLIIKELTNRNVIFAD